MKDVVVEPYVVYGMNVFDYEVTEKQRIVQKQTDESSVEGGILKKYRREEERRTMQMGVFAGVPVDDDYGFSDEETTEMSLQEMQQVSPEEQLKESRETRLVEM